MDDQPAKERANIRAKLARLESGGSPRLVDLFAGCGGVSVGFKRAGYEIAGGVEIDQQAAGTHAANFFGNHDQDTRERHATPRDITTYTPQQFLLEVLGANEDTQPGTLVDVIAGGPPCQAFARIGRAKLREIMQQPLAHLSDDRASLYLRYLQYVQVLKPLAVVMENVPEIMNFGGQNVAEEIARSLEEMGYRCRYTLLNSALYGVPQLRSRWFLIALHSSLGMDPTFPAPTHYIEIPSGYTSAHAAALKLLPQDAASSRYSTPPAPSSALPAAVTTRQALDDLPRIMAHLHGTMRIGPRRFDVLMGYRRRKELSAYAQDMREWPGFESNKGIWDHVTRYLPRDFPIFKRMRPGDEYPRAHELAMQILEEALVEYQAEHGTRPAEGSDEYARLRAAHVPPYSVEKFPNKWWKLHGDQPSRTLTAHMGRDTYSHIHYDSPQARVLSVREAARLQSFPDGFAFTGSMNGAFRQIGNAVPPLQAYALAKHVLTLLSQSIASHTPTLENAPMQPEPMLVTV